MSLLNDVEISRIRDLAYERCICPDLYDHPWEHTENVVGYALEIAPTLDAPLREVVIAAYFHDVGRMHDGVDYGHGVVSDAIFRSMAPFAFPDVDVPSVSFAIRHHSGADPDFGGMPVIENYRLPEGVDWRVAVCLWDADRLDRPRIGRLRGGRVDVRFLSTDYAKRYANCPEHLARYGVHQPRWSDYARPARGDAPIRVDREPYDRDGPGAKVVWTPKDDSEILDLLGGN